MWKRENAAVCSYCSLLLAMEVKCVGWLPPLILRDYIVITNYVCCHHSTLSNGNIKHFLMRSTRWFIDTLLRFFSERQWHFANNSTCSLLFSCLQFPECKYSLAASFRHKSRNRGSGNRLLIDISYYYLKLVFSCSQPYYIIIFL